MSAPDRRTFLRTAGRVTLGAVVADGGRLAATSLPPPKPAGALKRSDGDGVVPLPAGATRRLGNPRMRIRGHINALQFSPTGTTLVSATSGELRGWDPRSGKVLFRLDFPSEASVDSGRLTTHDTFLLLVRPHSGQSHELRQYAFGTGKLLGRSPGLKFENSQRNAFAADGTLVAAVHTEALSVHDTTTGKERWRESLPPEAVNDCQFFPDGSTVAVAGKSEVRLFAAATGKPGAVLKVPDIGKTDDSPPPGGGRGREWVSDLAVSADGKWLAASVGDEEEVVVYWDVKAGTARHPLRPAGKPIAFSPDGSELATVLGGIARFWSVATGKPGRKFSVPRGEVQLSPDGRILAVASGDAAVLIDAGTGKHLPHSADPPGAPSALAFAGPRRLQGRLDDWGGWVEWDLKTGSSTLIRAPAASSRVPVTLTAGRVALYRTDKDGQYSAIDMNTGKALRTAKGAEDTGGAIPTVSITPDGLTLLGPSDEGLAVVTDAGRHVIPRTSDAPGTPTAIATNGRTAALAYQSGDNLGAVDLYDLPGRRFVRRLTTDGFPNQLLFGPDGSRVLVAHDLPGEQGHERRGTVTIFDQRTGQIVFKALPTDAYAETVVAYSHDGRMVARVSEHGRIVLWDVHASEVRTAFETAEAASINALAFSPDGRTLAASVDGGPVFLWDLYLGRAGRLTAVEIECAWWALHSDDAAAAFGAIQLLARAANQAVPLMRERIAPVSRPDPKVVDQLITGLDHREFRKREAAGRSLAALGERAQEPMAKALAGRPSPETRERLEKILSAAGRPNADQLARLRAIEIAEVIGTEEAGALLGGWADGAPGSLFTGEAAAAARRLAGRTK